MIENLANRDDPFVNGNEFLLVHNVNRGKNQYDREN